MARVFEVEEPTTGERLALKLLTQTGFAAERFNREYRALTRLDHPSIVRVYRFGLSEDSRPFLTMELLDGVPAQVYAKSCGRPGTPRRTAEVIRIVTAVADALVCLHRRGIVHRDLKSSNVLVLPDGRVKLLDLGTARLLRSVEEITRHGEFIGTFAYASPEQLVGETVGPRSDIYSLGVLCYRLLSGKRPFNADSSHEMVRLHLEHVPRPPDQLVAGVPENLSDLVMRMLAKESGDRPASAEAVLEVLLDLKTAGVRRRAGLELSSPEVVGRDHEVRLLRLALERSRAGTTIVLKGSVGAGQDRMLAQVARDARALTWRVLEGRFRGDAGLDGLADVGRAAARGLPPSAEGGAQGADLAAFSAAFSGAGSGERWLDAPTRNQLLSTLCRIVLRRQRHEQRSVLILLHDLHTAHGVGIQALRVLREEAQKRQVPLLIVASGEATPAVPLPVIEGADTIELGPLSPEDVGRLIGICLGRVAPPPTLARRVHRATAGLPGNVFEVVHSLVQNGLLERSPGVTDRHAWRDRSGGQLVIPPTLRDRLVQTLDVADDTGRALLEAMAAAGGPMPAEALAAATGTDKAVAAATLEALAEHEVTSFRRTDACWGFRLGLLGQLVSERTRRSRRQVLQRRIAAATLERPPSAHKIRLLLSTGHLAQAVMDTVAWAGPCLAERRTSEALPLLERVCRRVARHTEPLPIATEARLHLLFAQALRLTNLRDERMDRVLERAGANLQGFRKTEWLLERAALTRERGDWEHAQEILAIVTKRLVTSPSPRLRVRSRLEEGAGFRSVGQPVKALKAFEWAENTSRRVSRRREQGEALLGRGLALAARGELQPSERCLRGAHQIFLSLETDWGAWQALIGLSEIHRQQASFTEALEILHPCLDQARMGELPLDYAGILLQLAETEIELYRLGEARDRLSELSGLDIVRGHPVLSAAAARVRGRLLLVAGESAEAVSVLAVAVPEAGRFGLVGERERLRASLGEALSHEPTDAELAREELDTAVARLARMGLRPALAEACAARARALTGQADPEHSFRPVTEWLSGGAMRLFQLTRCLEGVRFAHQCGDRPRLHRQHAEGRQLLEEISSGLNATDQAALSVHPWRQQLDSVVV